MPAVAISLTPFLVLIQTAASGLQSRRRGEEGEGGGVRRGEEGERGRGRR